FAYLHVLDLKVSAAFRGRGIGRALIEAGKAFARELGYRGLYLEAQDNNLEPCRFYLRCGFQETGIKWNMYGVPMEVLCYQKQLTLQQCEKMYRYLYGRFWFLPIRRISCAHSQNSDIT
ncbi:GNAT family N-acetyltransferase, partial [Anaerotignum sp.]|uniref:GNAT family N-acetyltransferase n=1 Tax=Anaerotignum sp. TaxID=2039241 RepID=UPI0037369B7F